jgi:ABC-type transporter Mla MlaB component
MHSPAMNNAETIIISGQLTRLTASCRLAQAVLHSKKKCRFNMTNVQQTTSAKRFFQQVLLSDMTYSISLLCEQIGKNAHDGSFPDLYVHRHRHA